MADAENVLPIEEIMRKYVKEWVAVRVVERDDAGQPLRAEVLSHSTDRHRLKDDIVEEKEACVFYAGPIPREGHVAIL